MRDPETKVLCQTPTPGKAGTNIPEWKYLAVRRAILKAVPRRGEGIAFRDLSALVSKMLRPEDRRLLGSVTWHTVTVKLHLEVLGELERVPGVTPQRLRRAK
ncbi:MAG: hypothetical protein IT349_20410 [Candidatus Eisenbacteria bacterium]|nr:hypothetical protein [Candidatus Eisenbacteria bacterium]